MRCSMSQEVGIWGWLQVVESVVVEDKLCVWFVVVPAESAKQAINRSNLIRATRCGIISKHTSQIRARP